MRTGGRGVAMVRSGLDCWRQRMTDVALRSGGDGIGCVASRLMTTAGEAIDGPTAWATGFVCEIEHGLERGAKGDGQPWLNFDLSMMVGVEVRLRGHGSCVILGGQIGSG
ncbi:hypothetical protein M0R45_008611 [Rubus argutus]|uniref:Uncharacterized protein n=1 Tax=Rubus argutus TaxID=59490 RepID=A0AAW1Y2K8_RUBAR